MLRSIRLVAIHAKDQGKNTALDSPWTPGQLGTNVMTNITYAVSGPTPLEKFNDDLLLTDADQILAQERFPEVAHVLNFPDLRDIDRSAIKAGPASACIWRFRSFGTT